MFSKMYIQFMVRNVGNLVRVKIIYTKTKGHCPKRTFIQHFVEFMLEAQLSFPPMSKEQTPFKSTAKKFSNYLSHC